MRKIGVAGAGGIGSITGGYMSKGGEDVTLIEPTWMEHVQAIRQHGLIIDSYLRGRSVVNINALHASELNQLEKGSLDILFVAVKSMNTERTLNLMLPYLKDNARVVSLQNGINTEVISSFVGNSRTIGCSINLWAELWKAGQAKTTGTTGDSFIIGEVSGEITPHIKEIAQIMSLCGKVETTTNIMGHLWTKLAMNCNGNGMAAITGFTANALLRDERVRHMYRVITAEVTTVGEALGYSLEPIWGLSAELWKRQTKADIDTIEHTLFNMGKPDTKNYASMFHDIFKDRPTEIDWLNGYVVKRGKETGIPTPANAVMCKLVKEVEEGKLKYGPHNIDTAYRLITGGN